ncbi:TPA: hypothetical protein ACH3X2_005536, partial [Trebouxia sp. C0005]
MPSITQEVSCMHWRSIDTVHVSQQADGSDILHVESADVGGGIAPVSASSQSDCVLSWTFSEAEPLDLQLTETYIDGQRGNCKLTVSFGAKLFPHAVFHQTKGIFVLTADGVLHSLALSDQLRHGSLLDGLAISSVNLRREIQKLGGPTTLALGTANKPDEASICIGGRTGSILIVPANCFETQSASGCHELHITPSGYLGFFSKSTTPAVTWTASLQPFAPELLCALHSDCSLCFWNIRTHQRVLVENLLQQSGQRGHVSPTAVGSVCSAQGHLRLVLHLDPKADAGVPPQTVAVSMDLEQASGQLLALNMRERMLEHSRLRFQSILTHTSTADAESAQTWLLSDAPSLHAVLSSVSGTSHEKSCRAVLMEKQGVDTGSGQQKLQDGLWQSIQDSLLEQTGHSLRDDTLATHFMQQILAPGVLSQQALSHALLELEEPLARYNASMSEVQQHLTAAAQGISAREKCSQLTSWRRVVHTYWKHWGELHRAVGLVELPQGTIAIVRSGHMLTLLQKADTLSVSQQGTSILTDVSPAHAGQTGDLRLLLQCVELLQQLLGQDVVNLFVHLCAHPPANASLHSIGCAYTEVLFTGPQLGGLPDQPQAADTRDALRSWRRQRSAAILQLGHLISQMSQGTPMPALRDYITHIAPAAPSANAMSTQSAAQLATSAGHALTIMLRQFATQQLQSASFMLLLTWFDSLRAAGALHITAAVSNALKQEIAPQLRAHIRSTSITLWLCTAPAAAVAGDETARLKHSELSSKLASLDFVSGGRQQAHHQQCLAELFLPDFAAHCGGKSLGHEPHVAVEALASYFQAGCSQQTVPSAFTGSVVVQQVVAVGQKLIRLHQVAHMHNLLALAGEAADTPGAAFLR